MSRGQMGRIKRLPNRSDSTADRNITWRHSEDKEFKKSTVSILANIIMSFVCCLSVCLPLYVCLSGWLSAYCCRRCLCIRLLLSIHSKSIRSNLNNFLFLFRSSSLPLSVSAFWSVFVFDCHGFRPKQRSSVRLEVSLRLSICLPVCASELFPYLSLTFRWTEIRRHRKWSGSLSAFDFRF